MCVSLWEATFSISKYGSTKTELSELSVSRMFCIYLGKCLPINSFPFSFLLFWKQALYRWSYRVQMYISAFFHNFRWDVKKWPNLTFSKDEVSLQILSLLTKKPGKVNVFWNTSLTLIMLGWFRYLTAQESCSCRTQLYSNYQQY